MDTSVDNMSGRSIESTPKRENDKHDRANIDDGYMRKVMRSRGTSWGDDGHNGDGNRALNTCEKNYHGGRRHNDQGGARKVSPES